MEVINEIDVRFVFILLSFTCTREDTCSVVKKSIRILGLLIEQ